MSLDIASALEVGMVEVAVSAHSEARCAVALMTVTPRWMAQSLIASGVTLILMLATPAFTIFESDLYQGAPRPDAAPS